MLLVLSFVLLAGLLWVEPRAANPILPLELFRDRLFATAVTHGFASGFAMFGIASFMPFYVQSVLGTSATAAGAILTPLLFSWVLASITGTRLLLHFSYRSLARVGMTSLVIGTFLMTRVGIDTPYWMLVINMSLMGLGMGLSVPILLIAVQTTAPRELLGSATSSVQFSRSIGGTMGVSIMGVILAMRLAEALAREGVNPASVSLNGLMDSTVPLASLAPLRDALAIAVQAAFVVPFFAAVAAWIVAYLAPHGHLTSRPAAIAEAQVEEVSRI
jgi:MFS family permease